MNWTRGKVLFVSLLVVVTGTSIGISFYVNSLPDVRIGYLGGDLHQLAYYVAVKQGFYQEEGLTVEGISYANGAEVMISFESLNRPIDMAYLGFAPAITHRFTVASAKITVLAGVNVNGTAIVVNNSINSMLDLIGKKIAIPARNNMQDFILRMALDDAGLKYDDVTTVPGMSGSDMITALQGNSIDAFVSWEPFPSRATYGTSIVGKILNNSGTLWPNHPCCVIASHDDFIASHRDIVAKVLKVHVKATQWILDNWEAAKEIAMADMNLSNEQATAAMSNVGFQYEPILSEYVTFLQKLVALNPSIAMNSTYIPAGMNETQFINYFVNTTILHSIL
ncbi:MAG: ABC transporter, substrate-binding protein, aliphatic sulfonates family [Promethearchaeota archaeon CR_4]|nr:MAG: ABC transporter, substrate-binding protein, aliphatic sulfonates family [Candidatus Lokiarchaeota archaeon CR_4]